jgi:hypothetical protein
MEPLGLDVPTTPLVRADEDRQGFADSFPVSGQMGAPEASTLTPRPRNHRPLELGYCSDECCLTVIGGPAGCLGRAGWSDRRASDFLPVTTGARVLSAAID